MQLWGYKLLKSDEDLKIFEPVTELKIWWCNMIVGTSRDPLRTQTIYKMRFFYCYLFKFVPAGLWITHWANSEETNPFLINNLCETRLSSSMWTQGTRPRSSIFSAVFFNRKLATPLFLKSSLVLNIPATPSLKEISLHFKWYCVGFYLQMTIQAIGLVSPW